MYILWLKMSDLPPNAVKKIRKTQPHQIWSQILTCNHWLCWQAVAAAEARRLWMGWMCPQKYPQIPQQDVNFDSHLLELTTDSEEFPKKI